MNIGFWRAEEMAEWSKELVNVLSRAKGRGFKSQYLKRKHANKSTVLERRKIIVEQRQSKKYASKKC